MFSRSAAPRSGRPGMVNRNKEGITYVNTCRSTLQEEPSRTLLFTTNNQRETKEKKREKDIREKQQEKD
jgi:hypothetical protein